MVLITPSLFDVEMKHLAEAIKKTSNADMYHIDVTDGVAVKDKQGGASTFFQDKNMRVLARHALNAGIPLDVHLMVDNPLKDIERYAAFNPKYITFHLEYTSAPGPVIRRIRGYEIKPAIAINPDTPVDRIKGFLHDVDMILLMSVVPGLGGQGYMPKVTKKIEQLRAMIDKEGLDVLIQVDGGIKVENVYVPINAGVDVIVSGSGIFCNKNQKEAIEKMGKKVYIAADHGGFDLKDKLVAYFEKKHIPYEDLSGRFDKTDDYPDYAKKVAAKVAKDPHGYGVLICGTGTGMCMAANRAGVRAVKAHDAGEALLARLHNDARVLCLGGLEFPKDLAEKVEGGNYKTLLDFSKPYDVKKAIPLVDAFLNTPFEGGRHQRRIELI